MAQQLKVQVKDRIINSAKEEFAKYSYDNASLRRIAARAHMTPGNLYRYFKNKEELLKSIVTEPMREIKELVLSLTDGQIQFGGDFQTFKPELAKMPIIFRSLSEGLVSIFFSYPEELKIMMLDTAFKEELVKWFALLISSFLHTFDYNATQITILSRGFAVSIFSGIGELLTANQLSSEEMAKLINDYFDLFLVLLKVNI